MNAYRIYDGYAMSYQDTPTEEFPCMRWTGWKDTKGNKVYETDILSNGRAQGVLEYDDADCRFVLRSKTETRGFYEMGDFVVIGNAFENKELV